MPDSYKDILRAVRYPADVMVLDFETYFDKEYSLSKMSTVEYIMDERFEVLGLATYCPIFYTPQRFDFGANCGLQDWAKGGVFDRVTVVMQNARFDASILAFRYGIRPKYIIDTVDLASHIDARAKHHLKDLAERYGLPAKGDTKEFLGLTSKKVRASGEWQRRLSEYATRDAWLEFELIKILLPKLSNPVMELKLMRHTLDLYLNPLLEVDTAKGEWLIASMQGRMDRATEIHSAKTLRSEKKFFALLQDALGDEPVPMKAGKRKPIMALARTDPELEMLLNHTKPGVRELVSNRVAVKSWPTHIKRVESILQQAKCLGGKLPVALKYYGGHTGRWSGSEGINLQNLGARADDPLINEVRELLVPPPGHKLIITDASQIEARVLVWLAQQQDMVAAFANGESIYINFVRDLTGKPLRKARKADPPALQRYLTHYRQMGKVGILGCGYGMGASRCREQAANDYGIAITEATAKELVRHYRKKNDKVCLLWNKVENALRYVTRYPDEQAVVSSLRFINKDSAPVIQLPSTREIYYPGLYVDYNDKLIWANPRTDAEISVWGGFIVENIVQSISRDILAEAMLNVDEVGQEIGLRIALHCHDEIVGVAPVDVAEDALDIQIRNLSNAPAWASGCPLAAEGFIAECYRKG